ncbi:hypothetical protein ACS0TY_025731 [Phlomoides rotata]
MEITATSFRNLLQHISKAVAVKESTSDYANLLREIFEERGTHEDTAFADSEIRPQIGVQNSQILFGRDNEVEWLLSRLLDPYEKGVQLSVITIIGDRGIGKTSLARMVYDDAAVKMHFEVRVWVTVEGEEFKLQQAAHGILKSTMGMSCSVDDLDELGEMVRDSLHSLKCLIVFDGVESMGRDFWLYMNEYWFDFVDFGSMVLITTTDKDVTHSLAKLQVIELTQLSWKDSWSLCESQLSFHSTEGIKNISWTMANNISSLCWGNPLALRLVGSMSRYDEKLRDLLYSVDFSDVIVDPPLDVSFPILLCIWALPVHLRQCFAYCAVFPTGYALNKEKIIDLWIARGLVKTSPENKSLEDIGNAYFHQLLYRSFFTDITSDQYGDIIEFRIPNLIHDIGEHVARIVYNEKLGLIGSLSEDAGQLSLLSFPRKYKSEDLQILILGPTLYLASSLDHPIPDFHRLQSLDLSCSGIQKLSDDICELKELRYLNLSYTLIERLPDSIMGLSLLQTLDLSWCYHLKVLPKGMCKLMHMGHLDLSWCDLLSCLPSGIGFLRSLTSMPVFVLGKDDGSARLGELGQLNLLRGRLEIRNLENVGEASEARNAKLDLKNLQYLGLTWSQNADDCFKVLEYLQPNPCLKVLNLTGYMGYKFPRWLSSINSLIKISISNCACKQLPSLGQLPFLKELQLNRMMNLEFIDQEFYGGGISDVFFPSLEQLELYDLPRLLEWSAARVSKLSDLDSLIWSNETVLNTSSNSVFRSLNTLTVEGCPDLRSLPSLPTLSNLMLKNSSKTILYSLTSFTSLSSLLINDMEVGQKVSFGDLGWWESLKKLVLCNIREESLSFYKQRSLTALEHLGILHCHELVHLSLKYLPSLQKLHIVDCPNISEIFVRDEEEDTQLMELVVEDCPQAFASISFHKFHSLRKLILKNCDGVFDYVGDFQRLEKLEYLSISECPKLESGTRVFPSITSHIPCIIVENHKVNFKDSQDLREDLISAVNEPKSEVTVPPQDGFSHGPQKSITEQFIQNVMAIKYKEIKKATKIFGPDMMLGQGEFGTVFKGWIHERHLTAVKPGYGISVAVKKWSLERKQEWLNEVKYLSQLHHPNLVKLIGYCIEKGTRILVYKFMPRGSLKNHLFSRRHQSLSWATRINVAVGAARGLSFLHDLEVPVIHRNVKSGDFLLDGEFNVKLSDFGKAKDGPIDDMSHISTRVMGTIGYIAPEYMMTGRLSSKSDVYGFGVVLLELLSGLRAYDTSRAEEHNLVEWAKPYLGDKKKLLRIMDTRLNGRYSHDEAYRVAELATLCLSLEPKDRPTMTEVVAKLEQLLPKTLQ